jgi:hypothetical protein
MGNADLMPSHTLEQKITKLHNNVELILKSLGAMMFIWNAFVKTSGDTKMVNTLGTHITKSLELRVTLPQKYILDNRADSFSSPACTPSLPRRESSMHGKSAKNKP